jgi:hypothetical protein
MNTLSQLRGATVAHTDAGDYLHLDGELQNEFLVKGKIIKERAGLFFLNIEGEKYTTIKRDGFAVGEEVACIVRFLVKEEGKISFMVKGLEKHL